MKKSLILAALVVVITFVTAVYFYTKLPDVIIAHWNAAGQPDGYMSKSVGLFVAPVVSAVLVFLFWLIPKIDPLNAGVAISNNKYFAGFTILMPVFMLYIFLLTVLANLGISFNFMLAIVPVFAILFFYLGLMVENTKRNWFVGVRTPWTMSSDEVWDKTHKLSGIMFKGSALISLIGMFFGQYAVLFLIVPAILSAIVAMVYSYVEYKKLKKLELRA